MKKVKCNNCGRDVFQSYNCPCGASLDCFDEVDEYDSIKLPDLAIEKIKEWFIVYIDKVGIGSISEDGLALAERLGYYEKKV